MVACVWKMGKCLHAPPEQDGEHGQGARCGKPELSKQVDALKRRMPSVRGREGIALRWARSELDRQRGLHGVFPGV